VSTEIIGQASPILLLTNADFSAVSEEDFVIIFIFSILVKGLFW